MKKIHIIIIFAAGILSFAGMFGITSFVKKSQSEALGAVVDEQLAASEVEDGFALKPPAEPSYGGNSGGLQKSMLEDQLRNLILVVRETIQDQKSTERDLAAEEKQIQMAHATLLADIDRLSKIHDQMKFTISVLKSREASLDNILLEIETTEKKNLVRIAATYDKMDVTQSSEIMINMASSQQLDDAVKIMYLMSERTAAKLLGEISANKPELASLLTIELTKVKDGE